MFNKIYRSALEYSHKKFLFNNTRNLSLHEYMSLDLLRSFGVGVPSGSVASNPQEAYEIAKSAAYKDFVVKAQVLAGGRGKGHFKNGLNSGIHLAYSPKNVKELCTHMIGQRLITKQTGENGLPCNKVLISERLYIRREYYVAFTLDRNTSGPVLIGSSHGGVNIEEKSADSPQTLQKLYIDINKGLNKNETVQLLTKIGFSEELKEKAAEELVKMYKLFIASDLTLLEINPLCETNDGRVVCMDCKIQVDDNALFRQEKLSQMKDNTQENPLDVEAENAGLNYIGLGGTIGCLVNGAGLAMATMDILKLHGGNPANFLDIGGGATINQVVNAFKIITGDNKVKSVFVNIFGGIMRCDIIAEGLIKAAESLDIKVPLVVRLQGTNEEEAKLLFADSKLRIFSIDDLEEAAKISVKLASIVELAHDSNINVHFELPI